MCVSGCISNKLDPEKKSYSVGMFDDRPILTRNVADNEGNAKVERMSYLYAVSTYGAEIKDEDVEKAYTMMGDPKRVKHYCALLL